MSEFSLVIMNGDRRLSSTSSAWFCICKEESMPPGSLLVGKRDPERPIEWKQGQFYYNPYFERKTAFIYRGDQKMVSIEGHSLSRLATRGQYERSWFEVLPQSINSTTLPGSIKNMIEAIPQQVKPVSQALMQNLGLRVPADFKPKEAKDWFNWLSTVQIPIGSHFKLALKNACYNKVSITREVEVEFLTGKKLPVSKPVHIRMFRVQETLKRVRQIYETPYTVVHVPVEILEKGPQATQDWILNSEMENRFILEKTPISEKVLKEEIVREGETGIIGYLRDPQVGQWVPIWPIENAYTANDLVREIMEEKSTY